MAAFLYPAAVAAGGFLLDEAKHEALKYAGKKLKKVLKLKRGGKVPYNKKPRFMFTGGRVKSKAGMTRYQKTHDSVRAILMPGEIVIPKYYQKNKKKRNLAKEIESYLRKEKVILPGM